MAFIVPHPPDEIIREMPEGMSYKELCQLWATGWVHGLTDSGFIDLPVDEDLRIYAEAYNAGEDERLRREKEGGMGQDQSRAVSEHILRMMDQAAENAYRAHQMKGAKVPPKPSALEVWAAKNFNKIVLTFHGLQVLGLWVIALKPRRR